MSSDNASVSPTRPRSSPAGFAGTRRFPAEIVELPLPRITAQQCDFVQEELTRHNLASEESVDVSAEPRLRFFDLLAFAHRRLLEEGRFFYPETAELLDCRRDATSATLAVPGVSFQKGLSTELLVNLSNGFAQSAAQDAELGPWLTRLREQLAGRDRPSSNTANFIDAAVRLGVPVIELPARQMQLGHGCRAAVLKGSITHQTSSFGVSAAKQKSLCRAMLAQAGFPVAEGAQIATLEQARKLAREYGYPVVVKPADLDGGEAVSCDIRTDEELEQAFRLARAASPNVIVERHIAGADFRLLFYGDRVLKRIARFPGGVTGNGTDSIAQLLGRMNAEPARHRGRDAIFYPLDYDEEAELMLRRRGMTPDSVPADGEFVQLRRAANFALGGSARLVEEEIHPDNLDLCRRAMRLLRLDLAGLDLILPDITRSWRDAGGVICEVNAQPFIGASITRNSYTEILEELVPGDGRIPVVLVVGKLEDAIVGELAARVPGLAVIDHRGAVVGGHPVSRKEMSWLAACQATLLDPQVAAALCVLDPAKVPRFAPVDRFSSAWLLDPGTPSPEGGLPSDLAALLRRAGGNVAADPRHDAALGIAGLEYRPIAPDRLLDELAEALRG